MTQEADNRVPWPKPEGYDPKRYEILRRYLEKSPDVTMAEAIEKIDIGGPSLVRAAAKNNAFTTIATDSAQYSDILDQVTENGATTFELRQKLAGEAFAHTAKYDQAIAEGDNRRELLVVRRRCGANQKLICYCETNFGDLGSHRKFELLPVVWLSLSCCLSHWDWWMLVEGGEEV